MSSPKNGGDGGRDPRKRKISEEEKDAMEVDDEEKQARKRRASENVNEKNEEELMKGETEEVVDEREEEGLMEDGEKGERKRSRRTRRKMAELTPEAQAARRARLREKEKRQKERRRAQRVQSSLTTPDSSPVVDKVNKEGASMVLKEDETRQIKRKRSMEYKRRRGRRKRGASVRTSKSGTDENGERRPNHSNESREEPRVTGPDKGSKYSPTQSIFLKLMSDPDLVYSDVSFERLQAVHTKLDTFMTKQKGNVFSILGGLKERVYSILVCHALKIMSSKDGLQLSVIQYNGHDFKVLPATDVMDFIDDKINSESSGGMIRILVKTGHLRVPSFCVSGQNQKTEKLNRRRNRVRRFRRLCYDMLVLSKFDATPSNSDGFTLVSDDLQRLKVCDETIKSIEKGKAVAKKRDNPDNCGDASNLAKKARVEELNEGKNENKNTDKKDLISKHSEKKAEILKAEEVANIIVDTHLAIDRQNTDGASTKETSNTVRENPVSAHETISEKISAEQVDQDLAEDPQIMAKKLKNKLRNERRKRGKILNKSAEDIEGFDPTALSPAIVKTVCSLVLQAPVSTRGTDTPQQLHTDNQNPARLEKDAHYVCWFDTSSKAFCYRKLLQSSRAGNCSRHRPYHSFRNNATDTEHSPVIQIEFERLPMNRTDIPAHVSAQRLDEMRKTCVANTLPPPTNQLPPWNPIYANLYIMEVKANDQHEHHHSSLIEIWKYPLKQSTKFAVRIRSG